jgi:hypothetical protein
MAAPPRQAVDSGAITAVGTEEQLLLCVMRKKLGDGTTSVLRVPLLSVGLAACGLLELLLQP